VFGKSEKGWFLKWRNREEEGLRENRA